MASGGGSWHRLGAQAGGGPLGVIPMARLPDTSPQREMSPQNSRNPEENSLSNPEANKRAGLGEV